MALSAEDAATLASLKAARDKLVAGTNTVRVSSDSGDVTYGAGDIDALTRRIDELEVQNSTTGRRRGAIRFKIR